MTRSAALGLLGEHHGIKAEDVESIRVLVYTFECRTFDDMGADAIPSSVPTSCSTGTAVPTV